MSMFPSNNPVAGEHARHCSSDHQPENTASRGHENDFRKSVYNQTETSLKPLSGNQTWLAGISPVWTTHVYIYIYIYIQSYTDIII